MNPGRTVLEVRDVNSRGAPSLRNHAHLVDAWLVLDVLGTVGVAQRRQCLIVVPVCRPHVSHHNSLGVAAQ